MHYFNSSAIHAASYDAGSQTLTIWFTSSGQPYDYYGVPSYIWHGFLTASSAGTYFNQFIRDQYAA
ncbi:MAG: KTSC domain-containing protein [Pseudomonadota bacterium]